MEQMEEKDELNDLDMVEIKLDTEYLLQRAILMAQNGLSNSMDIKIGFLKYRLFIEHAESIAKGMGLLSEDYYKELDQFIKSEETKKLYNEDKDIYYIKIAEKKTELIVCRIVQNKPFTASMSL